jgi:hypothetical protein
MSWLVSCTYAPQQAASAIVSLFDPPWGVAFSYLGIIKSIILCFPSFFPSLVEVRENVFVRNHLSEPLQLLLKRGRCMAKKTMKKCNSYMGVLKRALRSVIFVLHVQYIFVAKNSLFSSHYVRFCVVGRAGTRTFPQCSCCNRLFSKQQFSNGAAVGCAECMLLVWNSSSEQSLQARGSDARPP